MVKRLSADDRTKIEQEIARAEEKTSAEICVHVRSYCLGDPLQAALKIFSKLGLNRTEGRNAVLIYVALSSRKVAIYGDKAIHEWVGTPFWERVLEKMGPHFQQGDIPEGIVYGVREVGSVLAARFPAKGSNPNELTNTITED